MVRFARPFWIEHEGCPIFSVDTSPDGKKFVTGGGDGKVRVWNIEALSDETVQPKLYGVIYVSTLPVNICRFSPDGTILAVGNDDKIVSLWKSEGMKDEFEKDEEGNVYCEEYLNIGNLRGHVQEITDISWSPDGKFLASSSADNTVTIWDITKMELKDVFRGHNSSVFGVAWDPINKYIVSMDVQKVVIWDIKTLEEIARIEDVYKKANHGNFSSRISWSPDGMNIVVGSAVSKKRHVALLIRRNKWTVQLLTAHLNEVICSRFSPEIYTYTKEGGKKKSAFCTFATGGMGGDCCIWENKKDIDSICLVTDVFDNSIQDIAWANQGKMVLLVGLEGFLACIEYSNEELKGEVLKGKAKTKLLNSIYQREVEIAELERDKRKEMKTKLSEEESEELLNPEDEKQKIEEENEERKRRITDDGLTEEERKQLEVFDKIKQSKELKKNNNKKIDIKRPEIKKNEPIKSNGITTNPLIKKQEIKDESREQQLQRERAERLEKIDKMEFNKNIKKLEKIDQLEEKIKWLNERIEKIDWEKISQKVHQLELSINEEKQFILQQPVVKPLSCNSRDQNGSGVIIKGIPTTYGKKMFTCLKCIKIIGDIMYWEAALPYELVVLNCYDNKVITVSKENIIILLDSFSGSICNVPLMNNGIIYNAFYNEGYLVVLECNGIVKVYNNQFELIKVVNIEMLLTQLSNKKPTNIQFINHKNIIVSFDNEMDVLVHQGSYKIIRCLIQEDEKRRNISIYEKRKVELEIIVMQLFNEWDEKVFKQTMNKYIDALKQTNDFGRAKVIVQTLNRLKMKWPSNESCINLNQQEVIEWLTPNGMK
ncbi:WD domain, G-beta repeat containing protein [Entamoeba histolytica HM-1:IMSS-B]|uniref:Protein HIRA n=6 Tax=Entamoeba histolytica TaxID=5759 RepID=C4M5F1_ENTH1|nr:WD domain containing protein [Entamoeba histolytica HM-1:IMSS]EMD42985.1 WD domain containing protein [Entamoeba histolytica KU27]EMH75950.1 WD domain, G-beta repeat containing protein [Entamoeba histolytica HM-1:IMSS-B]EMS17933.1 WD domain, G-beta repeat-containing protein [Entamoeba histolytica HM-3:IMSS]ENY63296.1 WD domain, G-beta repeat-containing protein [Entamoeba histolytica HM-1:IMSS-A]GAT96644.1 WD domain containing protein [Entamoeba histolytica]|eukprot:XP_652608.1 WD domain containing protein [Entamoeba histolytica HM-1:IMSS]